jgi:hypothetical protein
MKTSEETAAYLKQQVQTFQKSGLSRIAYCAQARNLTLLAVEPTHTLCFIMDRNMSAYQ